ncbi:MAG TPA: hypothetical protein VFA82_06155 [Gaiellaceae bacterium]|nr:hypothetical protein [Gaiellaceae bacterium]
MDVSATPGELPAEPSIVTGVVIAGRAPFVLASSVIVGTGMSKVIVAGVGAPAFADSIASRSEHRLTVHEPSLLSAAVLTTKSEDGGGGAADPHERSK